MQADRAWRNGSSHPLADGLDANGSWCKETNGHVSIPISSLASSVSAASPSPSLNYIEHRVSKMDTLAGVAIKYGVEVADIKRMNGLVTDLQMFAHKSLQIPLPGRHPPSPILSNGSYSNGEQTPRRPQGDGIDSFRSLKLKPPTPRKVSPAMSSLQGYYGLAPPKKVPVTEGTEMAVYRTSRALDLEDASLPRESSFSEPLPSKHRKTRSLVNVFAPENGKLDEGSAVIEVGESEADRSNIEKSVRRRQKADVDSSLQSPELLMKEESSGGLPGRIGKGLALRPKSGSRTDMDMSRAIAITTSLDSSLADGFLSVRKSSSTSNLQESENGCPSLWSSSMWTLKPDAIARPIFDGLPKPITVRRNKAALD